MLDRVSGFNLTKEELNIELGVGASKNEVTKFADLISKTWKEMPVKPSRPTLILLGGFQGSGKTTTIEFLNQKSEFLIVSPDEIRHNLFAAEIPFSKNFVILVNAIKFELLKRALDTGSNIIVDQSFNPDRVKLTQEIATDNVTYHLKSIFLFASEEILRKRVLERPQLEGRYKGKIEELENSM